MKLKLLFIAVAALFALSATAAYAQVPDLDCAAFPSPEDAQSYLDADPSDPSGLDADGDGQACEGSEEKSEVKGVGSEEKSEGSASSSSEDQSAPSAAQYQYQYEASASVGSLPATGGGSLISVAAGILLIAGGLLARRLIR